MMRTVQHLQQDILRRMRAGEELRTVHKEGGTTIRFVEGAWLREDYGEWSTTQRFTDDQQFLAFLGQFFHAELSRNIDSSQPADEQFWSRIHQRLSRPASPGRSGPSNPGVVLWGMVVATALSIIFGTLRIAQRGRAPVPALDALFRPALVVLALGTVVAGLWLRSHWR